MNAQCSYDMNFRNFWNITFNFILVSLIFCFGRTLMATLIRNYLSVFMSAN